MGFQMNTDNIDGPFYNNPGGSIGYRKNWIIGFDSFLLDIFLESVRNLLSQESNLRIFSAFGVPDDGLAVFDIWA
jgi:hypothetical protein